MTAPDPGLTDLIAAHTRLGAAMDNKCVCSCSWIGHYVDHPAHVALVVEQHTNGRIAELDWDALVAAIPDGWELRESAQLEEVSRVRQRDLEASQATTARWRARAEKAEATITRVRGEVSAYSEIIPAVALADLRAALEGEQQ